MTPELISLEESFKVAQTLERIRSLANASEIMYTFMSLMGWAFDWHFVPTESGNGST